MGRCSAWSKLPPLGPGIAIDPVTPTVVLTFLDRCQRHYRLTEMEALCLLALLAGYGSSAEIARAVNIAEQTVMNHLWIARARVGCHDRIALLRLTWPLYADLRVRALTQRGGRKERAA